MKKVLSLAATAAMASMTVLAFAGENVPPPQPRYAMIGNVNMGDDGVIVKDTRQYVTYTKSLLQDGTCHVAKDPEHPATGDCEEERALAAVAGEFVTRRGGVCTRVAYAKVQPSFDPRRFPPVIGMTQSVFRCDAQGHAI